MNVFDAVSGVFFDSFSAHSPSHNKDTMNPRLKIDGDSRGGLDSPALQRLGFLADNQSPSVTICPAAIGRRA